MWRCTPEAVVFMASVAEVQQVWTTRTQSGRKEQEANRSQKYDMLQMRATRTSQERLPDEAMQQLQQDRTRGARLLGSALNVEGRIIQLKTIGKAQEVRGEVSG